MTSVAIVAHPARRVDADKIAQLTGADAVFWDNEERGCDKSHLAALRWHAAMAPGRPNGEYVVVLEDDVVPVANFRHHLDLVLAAAPSHVVSLYLGTGYPTQWQDNLRTAVPLDTDPHFLLAPSLLSCVGYAVRRSWVRELARFVDHNLHSPNAVPIDRTISKFCHHHELTVAYSRPSIVNHLDGDSLISERHDGQDRHRRRVAWKFGTRPSWCATATISLEEPRLVYENSEGQRFFETTTKEHL